MHFINTDVYINHIHIEFQRPGIGQTEGGGGGGGGRACAVYALIYVDPRLASRAVSYIWVCMS